MSQSENPPPLEPAQVLQPPPPPPGYMPAMLAAPAPVKRGGVMTRIAAGLFTSLLLTSIVLNVYFAVYFASLAMGGPRERELEKGSAQHRIVVLPAEGTVGGEMEDFIRQSLRALGDDPPRAIVMRVDSPGGDPFASDRIVHEIEVYRGKHPEVPIVASFGTVAASGGYYISAGADHIFAEPLCRTGSIGVISMSFTMRGLMEKLGLAPEVQVASGSPLKDVANNPFRDFTEQDRAEVQAVIDQLHERFVDVVHKGRSKHLSRDEVAAAASGRAFSAAEAQAMKLIDATGFLDDALGYAKSQANLPAGVEPRVTVIEPSARLTLGNLLGVSSPSPAGVDASLLRRWIIELQTPRAEYLYLPGLGR